MNRKIENIVKNVLHLITTIFILVVALQLNQGEKIDILQKNKNTYQIIKTEEIVKSNINRINKDMQVTSRSSAIRMKEKKKVEEDIVQEPEKEYTRIEDVTVSRNMDLTVRTGLSKEEFKRLISNVKQDTSKFFYNNSDLIYDLCEEYQLNEVFFCGLISAESGWNIASNHRRTYNYISLMTKGKLIQYSSLEEGLRVAAKTLHNNYLTEGGRFYNGKTLYGVKVRFCPASETWVNLVYGRMQQIIKSK